LKNGNGKTYEINVKDIASEEAFYLLFEWRRISVSLLKNIEHQKEFHERLSFIVASRRKEVKDKIYEKIDSVSSVKKVNLSKIVKELVDGEKYSPQEISNLKKKVQRFYKDTYEVFKTSLPNIVKIFSDDDSLLKAYILCFLYKKEYTGRKSYQRLIRDLVEGIELTTDEKKYIFDDFNLIGLEFLGYGVSSFLTEIEEAANEVTIFDFNQMVSKIRKIYKEIKNKS